MNISITTTGAYTPSGAWVPTEVTIVDQDGQRVVITQETNGSYMLESELIGDELPAFKIIPTFAECWAALPVLFGITELGNEAL